MRRDGINYERRSRPTDSGLIYARRCARARARAISRGALIVTVDISSPRCTRDCPARNARVPLVTFSRRRSDRSADSKEPFPRRIVRRYCRRDGEHRGASRRENWLFRATRHAKIGIYRGRVPRERRAPCAGDSLPRKQLARVHPAAGGGEGKRGVSLDCIERGESAR